MKKVLQIILFFAFLNIYAQEIKEYRILSVVDSMPIENAYITADNWLKTITDKKGFFKLSGDYQNIQISHLAFKAKIVKYKTMIINKITYLEADEKVLNEVIITNKKKIKTLLPSNDYKFFKRDSYMVNQNSVYTTFIPNEIENTCFINKIIIEVGDNMNSSKLYNIPFRVNLYTVNNNTGLPDKKILDESILTSQNKNRKNNFIYVDIRDFDIEFPKEGIFVAVESLNLLELEEMKTLSGQLPSFKAIKNKNKYVTYSRIYSWDRLTKTKDTIYKDWIDKILPLPKFVFNFGIEVQY